MPVGADSIGCREKPVVPKQRGTAHALSLLSRCLLLTWQDTPRVKCWTEPQGSSWAFHSVGPSFVTSALRLQANSFSLKSVHSHTS